MKQKLKSMDMIKGIGIIMIIIVHNRHFIMQDMSGLRPLINFGQMGCQLFFFVSGFTLCFSWEHMTNSPAKGLRFILRRYLRLAPGFLIFMIVNLGLNILLIDIIHFPSGFIMNRELPAILTNIFFLHGLFPKYINNVFPGGWYIGTAFLLYITFPLLYVLFKKLCRLKPLCMAAVPAVLLFLNCFLLRWISDKPDNALYLGNNTFLYFLFTNHIVCFCLGILLFFQERPDNGNIHKKGFCATCPLMLSILLFVLSAGICICLYMNPSWINTYAVIPSAAGLSAYWLAVALIHIEQKTVRKSRSFISSFLAECGKNSYGMYLAHPLVCWYGMKALTCFLTENNGTYNDILLYWLMLAPSVFVVYVMGCYTEKALTWIDRRLRHT